MNEIITRVECYVKGKKAIWKKELEILEKKEELGKKVLGRRRSGAGLVIDHHLKNDIPSDRLGDLWFRTKTSLL